MNISREFVMHNKAPLWNEGSQVYQLDFGGRVTQESAKNFQIEYSGKQVSTVRIGYQIRRSSVWRWCSLAGLMRTPTHWTSSILLPPSRLSLWLWPTSLRDSNNAEEKYKIFIVNSHNSTLIIFVCSSFYSLIGQK